MYLKYLLLIATTTYHVLWPQNARCVGRRWERCWERRWCTLRRHWTNTNTCRRCPISRNSTSSSTQPSLMYSHISTRSVVRKLISLGYPFTCVIRYTNQEATQTTYRFCNFAGNVPLPIDCAFLQGVLFRRNFLNYACFGILADGILRMWPLFMRTNYPSYIISFETSCINVCLVAHCFL